MKTMKYSRQRESIKASLMGRYDHPTADELYLCIREEFPNISLGTVYRNLNLLAELGEIQKLTFTEGPDRFDGNAKQHYHFMCRKCGRVSDLSLDSMEEVDALAQKNFPGRIEGHTLCFYGTCQSCLSQ